MKLAFILSLALMLVIVFVSIVQEGETFSLSLSNGAQRLRKGARGRELVLRRSRISSAKLAKLVKVLRRKAILKSKLHSLNRFLKKYQAKVRPVHKNNNNYLLTFS